MAAAIRAVPLAPVAEAVAPAPATAPVPTSEPTADPLPEVPVIGEVVNPEPPVSDPTGDPSAGEPPLTEPPTTEPPVTEPPTTQPPVTQPPSEQPPVADPPAQPADTRPFSPDSFWNKPLSDDAPLAPNSPVIMAELMRQVSIYTPWVNATTYSTPVYTVPADQPKVPVYLDTPSSMYTNATDAADIRRAIGQVPIPDGAKTATGVNKHMVIWQPSTDTIWELWNAWNVPLELSPWASTRNILGWHAAWGARIDNASQSEGIVPAPAGATASGLPLLGGLIRLNEWQQGHIDHALAFALPDIKRGAIVWPATRTDGRYDGPNGIPMGTRFRLDPTLDIDSLHLDPFVAMIARAAQKYGIVLRDHADDSLVFYGEDPAPTGTNPYKSILGSRPDRALRSFPWSRLQVLKPGD